MNKKWKHLIKALVIGFVVGSVIISIAIALGFSYAHSHDAGSYQVKLLGLVIYELTADKGSYRTVSIQANMGIVCGICMAIAVVVEMLWSHVIVKKK